MQLFRLFNSAFGLPVFLSAMIVLSTHAVAQTVALRVDGNSGSFGPSVDGSDWGVEAFKFLQDALALADDLLNAEPPLATQVEVWIAGTNASNPYRPDRSAAAPGGSGDQNASFVLINDCRLMGGFVGSETALNQRNPEVNITILSGDLDGDDQFVPSQSPQLQEPHQYINYAENSFHVVRANPGTNPALAWINGFRISGGNAMFSQSGGGLYGDMGAPSVVRCVFFANKSQFHGGGVELFSLDPFRARFVNCTFLANQSDNDGGGLALFFSAHADVTHCVFLRNHAADAGGGLAAIERSSVSITGCTFAVNSIRGGGGPTVTGGAMFIDEQFQSPAAAIQNSILWDKWPDEIDTSEFCVSPPCGFTVVSHSDIRGGIPQQPFLVDDQTNVNLNPSFCNLAGLDGLLGTLDDNARLSISSLIKDLGGDSLVPNDDADVDDNPATTGTIPWDLDKRGRLFAAGSAGQSANVDMGAFEEQHLTACPSDLNHDGTVNGIDLGILLNQWGSCPGCRGDLTCDTIVNGNDQEKLLADWGPCGESLQGGGGSSMMASGSSGPGESFPEILLYLGWTDIDEYVEWVNSLSEEEQLAHVQFVLALLQLLGVGL